MQKTKTPSVVKLPFPVFGAMWERDDVYVYGGGGSKYGIPSGIYFMTAEQSPKKLMNQDDDSRVDIDGAIYTATCIFSAKETLLHCVCVSENTQADDETSTAKHLITVTHSGLNVASIISGKPCPTYVRKNLTSKIDVGKNCLTKIALTLPLSDGMSLCDYQLLIATWSVSGAPYVGAFTWKERNGRPNSHVRHIDSMKVSTAISQCLENSAINFNLLPGEVKDIAAIARDVVGESALCAAVVEWKGHHRIRYTCLVVLKLGQGGKIVPFGYTLFDTESKGRFTKCVWMTTNSNPALGILYVSQKMTTLRKFSLNLPKNIVFSASDSFLTYEKITTCTSFAITSRPYLAAGTASGEILLFSLDPVQLERRVKICESPITGITVGPQAPPVVCATSLCGTVNFQSIIEIPKVISWYSFAIFLFSYGAVIFITFANKPWEKF